MNKMRKKDLVKIGIIFFILFSIVSTALGRSNVSSNEGLITFLKENFDELIQRITEDNQATSVIGFRYIYDYTEVQYGKDWFNMLKDVLPGRNEYTPVAIKIFAIIYNGSTRVSFRIAGYSFSLVAW